MSKAHNSGRAKKYKEKAFKEANIRLIICVDVKFNKILCED